MASYRLDGAASAAQRTRRQPVAWLCALLLAWLGTDPVWAQDAASLRARHGALREQLASNQFQRPLYVESSQTGGDLKGEIFSVVELPQATVLQALQGLDHWCDVLMLHLLVKDCRASNGSATPTLGLAVARTWDQPLDAAHRIDFVYKAVAASADYLQVQLTAESGPMGTKNYRIMLEAIPLDARSVFIHMAYSYTHGFAARLAMEGYLATVGRNKVGFTIVEVKPDGKPVYMGNVRGVVERNTMRYYLAVEAYLGALSAPPSEQLEKRMRDWYAGIERYPVQLHELERNQYLEMKRKEVQRQQAGAR